MSRKRKPVPSLDELIPGRPALAAADAPEEEETRPETGNGADGSPSSVTEVEAVDSPDLETSKGSAVAIPQPEQVTVYFSSDTVNLIETARFQLRIQDGIKATKSALVEACVRATIQDKDWLKEQLTEK